MMINEAINIIFSKLNPLILTRQTFLFIMLIMPDENSPLQDVE